MKVSVITPTLNRAPLMKQVMDSVFSQTYKDIEYVIVDGGSTDGTLEILKSYGDRIKWVSSRDGGFYPAINRGVTMTTGDVITFLNSDDFFTSPDVVEKVVADLKADPEIDLLCGEIAVTTEDGKHLLFNHPSKPSVLSWRCSINMPGAFIRRRLFDGDRRFDATMKVAGDYELFSRWVKVDGAKVKAVPRVHVTFALGGLSNSPQNSLLIAGEIWKVQKRYHGLRYAVPVAILRYVVGMLQGLGFRPQHWLRELRIRSLRSRSNTV